MFRIFTVLFFFLFALSAIAQINPKRVPNMDNRFLENPDDTTRVNNKEIKVKLSGKTHFSDYKIISHSTDTTFIDTTLNLTKYYKFNFTEKDNLELLAFQNQGQTFNNLAYSFNDISLYPKIGASGKHHNFYEVEDIKYYQVPTPTTILTYRTGMEQGQVMEGMFTFNMTKQFNASIAFKGLRSLGNYRHILSDHGNLRITMNYNTKNEKYYIRAHIAAQDINNEENGGLTQVSIDNFESGAENFKDRARLVTNFTDAQNVLRGNRYYFDQNYKLWQEKDSLKTRRLSNFKIGHIFNYERKHYEFEQDAANSFFGEAFVSQIKDDVKYSKMYNEIYINFNSPFILGDFKVNISDFDYSYSYKSMLISDDQIINSKLDGNLIAAGVEWQTDLKKFNLQAKASTIISGNLNGNYITANASYKIDSLTNIEAGAFTNKKSPNYNFLLFQSAYKSYNWQNDFDDEQTNSFYLALNSSKWFSASAQITSISNYSYFNEPDGIEQTKPLQSAETVNYLKVKISKEFKFGKFALDNSFIYQNVSSGSDVFRVPDFITRNSFYFSDRIFKGDPLHLQTGITFTYFSKYYMNAYNPLLSEFYLQNDAEYGGYPIFDFFINAEIKRTRFYLLFEHVNSHYTGYNYYSAPTYPYRDFIVRFGLVWNFFI
ncbi:MAG: putative porin [Bacteroidota bacterium]